MCRLLYPVLIATLLLMQGTARAQATPVTNRELQLQVSAIDRQIELEREEGRHMRFAGPITLFAVGAPAMVGGILYAGLAGLMASFEDEDGSNEYTARERRDVNRGIYITTAGAAIAGAGAFWLVRIASKRTARDRRIAALEQQRGVLVWQLLQPPVTRMQPRSHATQLAIAPLLSRQAQGLSFALTF